MADAAALAVFAVSLSALAVAVWRRPVVALFLYAFGLAVHNAVMAALYGAGVQGRTLSIIILWKELLLGVALARVAWDSLRARRLPFRWQTVDWLALAFFALLVLYAILPQSALGGLADPKARVYAFHHDALGIGGYVLGRSLRIGRAELQRLAVTLVGTGVVMAVVGLIDDYAVPISWWRRSAVPDFFNKQLGYDYHGTGNLPENFVYNVGGDKPFLRRLVSLFLTPLATSYVLVVALLVAVAFLWLWRARGRRTLVAFTAATVVMAAALLWTFSRASVLALAAGLCVLALVQRGRWPWLVGAAAVTVGVGVAFAHVFPSIAPTGRWTKADLVYQHKLAREHPTVGNAALSANESSIHSHLTSLRDGLRTVAHHPQGYGLGNAGTTAVRLDVPIKAGESDYTELGVETGLLGMLAFIAWNLALLAGILRSARRADDRVVAIAAGGVAASFAAVLLLAIQTDIYGVPWVALTVWTLAGALVAVPETTRAQDEDLIRTTWDALAHEGWTYIGPPERGAAEIDALFSRLHAEGLHGVCLEVGCGAGRVTPALARTFDRVVAVDASPAMLERAHAAVRAPNVELRLVSGVRLDGIADASVDAVVCYLVLQHLPARRLVLAYVREFARVLRPGGEAFVQLPLLDAGFRALLFRRAREAVVAVTATLRREPLRSPAFRGMRVSERELLRCLDDAGLDVVARDEGPDSPYMHTTDAFFRLRRRGAAATPAAAGEPVSAGSRTLGSW